MIEKTYFKNSEKSWVWEWTWLKDKLVIRKEFSLKGRQSNKKTDNYESEVKKHGRQTMEKQNPSYKNSKEKVMRG